MKTAIRAASHALALGALLVSGAVWTISQQHPLYANPGRLLRLPAAVVDASQPTEQAFRIGEVLNQYTHDRALAFRIADALVAQGKKENIDPALLVGVLLTEDADLNPRAKSSVGARGLMQVMPVIGKAIAHGLRYPYWNPDLLYEPDVNLELGIAHLRAMLSGRDPARALAAYNAGDGRVSRWLKKPGASDPEVFVERIPFVETRDYVRIVLRNRDIYRALYFTNP